MMHLDELIVYKTKNRFIKERERERERELKTKTE
jgi:hypothetical protein